MAQQPKHNGKTTRTSRTCRFELSRNAEHMTLIIMRHGERGGDPIEGLHGPSLTPMGHRQAKRAAKRLADVKLDHIYCSDMARSFQTAEPIRAAHPDVPWTMMPELREVGQIQRPVGERDRTKIARQRLAHEQKALNRVIRRLKTKHKPGQIILLVIHGNLLRALVPMLAGHTPIPGMAISSNNASMTVINWHPKKQHAHIRMANCTAHLAPSQIN